MPKRSSKSPILIGLALCGSLCACGTGPSRIDGEFSLAGLSYDLSDGGAFVGLDPTQSTQMPLSGNATYQGILQGAVDDIYRTGTATVSVDFATASLTASGEVDYFGVGDLGMITFATEGTVTGNSFTATDTVSYGAGLQNLTGRFYGPQADLAAGTLSISTETSQSFNGAFITEKQ